MDRKRTGRRAGRRARRRRFPRTLAAFALTLLSASALFFQLGVRAGGAETLSPDPGSAAVSIAAGEAAGLAAAAVQVLPTAAEPDGGEAGGGSPDPTDPAGDAGAGAQEDPAPAPAQLPAEKPAVPAQTPAEEPQADKPSPAQSGAAGEDWRLILVNPWTPLPDSHSVTLTRLKNGHAVDERCYPDLQAMLDDCRAAGLSPVICSSYRTRETQERLFQNKVDRLKAQGYSAEDARLEAGKAVAVPGTSEHQLGLAVDVVDLHNQNLNETQEDTAVQQWLMENSWRYGFILRYPTGKSDVTGIVYEPWHYRYVGKDAAKEIYERGVCLEEYLQA